MVSVPWGIVIIESIQNAAMSSVSGPQGSLSGPGERY